MCCPVLCTLLCFFAVCKVSTVIPFDQREWRVFVFWFGNGKPGLLLRVINQTPSSTLVKGADDAYVPPCVIVANTCDLFSTAKIPAALFRLFFCTAPVIHTSMGQGSLWGLAEQISSAMSDPTIYPKFICSGQFSWLLWEACLIVSRLEEAHEAIWAWLLLEMCGRYGAGKRRVSCFCLWLTFLLTTP